MMGSGLSSILVHDEITFIDKAWQNKHTFRENKPVQVRMSAQGKSQTIKFFNPESEKQESAYLFQVVAAPPSRKLAITPKLIVNMVNLVLEENSKAATTYGVKFLLIHTEKLTGDVPKKAELIQWLAERVMDKNSELSKLRSENSSKAQTNIAVLERYLAEREIKRIQTYKESPKTKQIQSENIELSQLSETENVEVKIDEIKFEILDEEYGLKAKESVQTKRSLQKNLYSLGKKRLKFNNKA